MSATPAEAGQGTASWVQSPRAFLAGNGTYVAAMIVLVVVALAGLGISIRLPANPLPSASGDVAPSVTASAAPDPAV